MTCVMEHVGIPSLSLLTLCLFSGLLADVSQDVIKAPDLLHPCRDSLSWDYYIKPQTVHLALTCTVATFKITFPLFFFFVCLVVVFGSLHIK